MHQTCCTDDRLLWGNSTIKLQMRPSCKQPCTACGQNCSFFISRQTIPVEGWWSSKKTMVIAKLLFFCTRGFTRWRKENSLRGTLSCNLPEGIVLVWPLCGSQYTLQPGRTLVQYEISYLLTVCGPVFIHSGRPLGDLSSQLWISFAHLFQRTVVVIANPSCLHCIETLVFLKIVFVRCLSLFSVGFEHYMYGVFILTIPLRVALLSKVFVL